PQRLRQINQEKLQAMGVPSDLVAKFLDHPSYSPTHATIIVSSLESLSGAKGRDSFIQVALLADDEETANFFQNMAETMKGYQLKAAPIREISGRGPVVFAKAANGVVLVPFPLDHGVWTERASQRIPDAFGKYKASNPGVKKYEVWVTGTVSKRAADEMKKLGVQVVENVDKRIEFAY
ncbi:MAG: hypothetical protein ABSG91_22185, partial [Syntrophobacteraceae bacterium]